MKVLCPQTKISDSSYTTYTWDYRNRLTAVKDYNSSNVLLKETTYAYDTHNRLIKSTYDVDGAGSGTTTSRFWAFDEGINPQLEFRSGSASDVSHRYVWGPAVDQLFADEQPTSTGSAGNVLWALGDNLGTVRDIADLSGSTTSVTNHRRFGAYGNLVSESNSAVDLAFAFTGKLYDENVKLQNNLNRWYDAVLGQWMSEDPIGFAAGDESLRRYVRNRIIDSRDPCGLQDDEPSQPSEQELKDELEKYIQSLIGPSVPNILDEFAIPDLLEEFEIDKPLVIGLTVIPVSTLVLTYINDPKDLADTITEFESWSPFPVDINHIPLPNFNITPNSSLDIDIGLNSSNLPSDLDVSWQFDLGDTDFSLDAHFGDQPTLGMNASMPVGDTALKVDVDLGPHSQIQISTATPVGDEYLLQFSISEDNIGFQFGPKKP